VSFGLTSRARRLLGPAASVVLFAVAAWVLHHELRLYHFHEILQALRNVTPARIWTAAGLTLLSYTVMTGYDALALRYIRRPLPYRNIGLASFVGYAFSNNIGLSMLAGASARYRLYSAWGLSGLEVTQVVAFCTLTLWLGFLAIGGLVFLALPVALPETFHVPFGSLRLLGLAMLAVVAAYGVVSRVKREPVKIRTLEFRMPSGRLVLLQIGLAMLDWILAGTVLFALLGPADQWSFFNFLGVFLLAQLLGLVSQVPGGLGVFETAAVLLLSPAYPAPKIFAALMAYRVLYYWLPLAVASLLLGGRELWRHKAGPARLGRLLGQAASPFLPQVIGMAVMVGGALLLFSGATPGVDRRLEGLRFIVPLPLLELSHFLGSLAGMGLILVGRGLQRRLDAAWVLSLALLATGIVASLLKGLDYEEAILLSLIVVGLLPSRKYFYRRSSLFSQRYSADWIAAIVIVAGASIWLGLLAYRHVEYSHSLWWQFAFTGDAPRFLRATVGAVTLALIVAMVRLLRPGPPAPARPGPEELARAAEVAQKSFDTAANLALLGDKYFLFSPNGQAFLMYGVEGRSWIALRDPVGPREEWPELVWRFRETADRYGGLPVFYQVSHESLPLYLDLGLTLLKIGEEARVPLADFSMEGSGRKKLRHALARMEKAGYRYEVLEPGQVSARMAELKEVSDAWLAQKNTREKSFSLGFFSPDYLAQGPAAAVFLEDRLVGFANLWLGAGQEEVSVDLMRYRPEAMDGVMDYLFTRIMLWGREQGYGWFNLGMAPLSGFEARTLAPLWSRLGAFVFRHGEHFYNFQGLRRYKQKFDPVWRPKYLASPGGLALPQIFMNLAALISGGLKGVVLK